jgi:predicted DCC family thiol-disulfide oxidoreductase YuxK
MSGWTHLCDNLTSRRRGTSSPARLVLFDGACGMCQRSVVVLTRLDLLQRLRFADVEREWLELSTRYPQLDRAACLAEMHVITTRGEVRRGFDAYRSLAWVLPPGWLMLPLLYIPGVPAVGRRVYGFVAARRGRTACALPRTAAAAGTPHAG